MPSLGKRHTCAKCGIPYYDLGNENHPCPVCSGVSKTKPKKSNLKKRSIKLNPKTARRNQKNDVAKPPSTELCYINFFNGQLATIPNKNIKQNDLFTREGWYVASAEKLSVKETLKESDILFLGAFPNNGLSEYLCGPKFKGIGPALARQLVGENGENLVDALASTEKLKRAYPDISHTVLEQLHSSWSENGGKNNLTVLLSDFGFADAQQKQVMEIYGSTLLNVINERPFELVKNIPRLTFENVLNLCNRLGISISEQDKILAATDYFLSKTEKDRQHTCAPVEVVISRVSALISSEVDEVANVLNKNRDLFHYAHRRNKEVVSTIESRARDEKVAVECARIAKNAKTLKKADIENLELGVKGGVSLSDEQIAAIKLASSNAISIVTGGPGAGKTTMVQGLVGALKACGKKIKLCAPTGRAAKRIAETPSLSSFKPSTIHMFLIRQSSRQEEYDYMIVDESSMIDIGLMLELLGAIPNGTNIIFIGDADQLPPVKSGQPFKDFIESEKFEIARLTGNFRQDTFSETVKAARSIIQGQSPQKSEDFHASDFVFFDVPQTHQSDKILQLYFESMPNKLGVRPTEIQILSPQRAGHVGINRLNHLIQNQTTRTAKPVLTRKSGNEDMQIFIGDKVIYRQNNYQLGVMNGDIGRVARESGNKLIVEFEDESGLKEVTLVGKDKFDMEVAYATTIHSSQGSEYPGVIVPVTSAHHYMLSRNLLYTAITRGKRQVCLVGEWHAFEKAISMFAKDFRYTLLSDVMLAN